MDLPDAAAAQSSTAIVDDTTQDPVKLFHLYVAEQVRIMAICSALRKR